MHRNNVLDLLKRYNPSDEVEIENKKKVTKFIEAHPDCFERSLVFGHLTGSCWLANFDMSQFLLTKHKKMKMWLQLGGHADGDNDIKRTAIREAREESGLQNIELISYEIFDLGVHIMPSYDSVLEHLHFDFRFLMRASDETERIQISSESDDLRWFSMPPIDNPDINRMFKKWKDYTS